MHEGGLHEKQRPSTNLVSLGNASHLHEPLDEVDQLRAADGAAVVQVGAAIVQLKSYTLVLPGKCHHQDAAVKFLKVDEPIVINVHNGKHLEPKNGISRRSVNRKIVY